MKAVFPISAIIPVTQRPKLVQQAILSIARGHALPAELIVVLSPTRGSNQRSKNLSAVEQVNQILQKLESSQIISKTLKIEKEKDFAPPLHKTTAVKLSGANLAMEQKLDAQAVQAAFAQIAALNLSYSNSSSCCSDSIETKLISCPRPYVAAARNEGVAHCKYSWVAFLDSDDLWHEDKLMKQWQYLIKRPHLKACHNLEQWIKSGNHLKQPQHLRPRRGRFLQAAFSHCLISCSALLIHKETFQQCGGFDESFEGV